MDQNRNIDLLSEHLNKKNKEKTNAAQARQKNANSAAKHKTYSGTKKKSKNINNQKSTPKPRTKGSSMSEGQKAQKSQQRQGQHSNSRNNDKQVRSIETLAKVKSDNSLANKSLKHSSKPNYVKKPTSRPQNVQQKTNSNFPVSTFALYIITIALVVSGIYMLIRKNATEIYINGESLGQVKTVGIEPEDLKETLVKKLGEKDKTNIQIEDDVSVKHVHGKNSKIITDSEMLQLLSSKVKYKVEAAEIKVGENTIGYAKSETDANSIFDEIYKKYIPDGANVTSKGFVEDVKIVKTYVPIDKVTANDVIKSVMEKNVDETGTYEIAQGDSLSSIAEKNNMTIEELKNVNPGVDATKLQIGKSVNVIKHKPFVSVKTVEQKVETMVANREIVENDDPTLEEGQTRILAQGKDGLSEVTVEVTKINGKIVDMQNKSEKVIEAAEPQIVAN